MNGFKRLCLFLYGLFGLCALAALLLTWVGPWTHEARALLEVSWYFAALLLMVGITAAGLVMNILRALFTPSSTKETTIATIDGGAITVTRNAIIAQVKNVIEEDESCKASNVRVALRKNNYVRVKARIKPLAQLDIVSYSADLHKRLSEGLRMVCGDAVKSIDLTFVEPSKRNVVAEEDSAKDSEKEAGISVDPSTIVKEDKQEEQEAKREKEAAEREERRNRRRNNRRGSQSEEAPVLKVRQEVLEGVSDQADDEVVEDVEPVVVVPEPEPAPIAEADGEAASSEALEFSWGQDKEPEEAPVQVEEVTVDVVEASEGEEA